MGKKGIDTRTAGSLNRFVKFCLVGFSGVIVDMLALHFLVNPRYLGWNVIPGKLLSAEFAMLNNFLWNELWTFKASERRMNAHKGWPSRLLGFHAICGLGIGLAAGLIFLFYRKVKLNLYVSNLSAIVIVTFWNFWLNAIFNWRLRRKASP